MSNPTRPNPLLALVLCVPIGALAAPAAGQTLSETIAAYKKQRAAQAEKKEREQQIRALQTLLYEKLTVQFDATPARDVFEYLAVATRLKLVVRYADDPVGHGIEPDTPITISAEGIPAGQLLELVLEQCGGVEECTWQLRRGFVEAGTKARLGVA